MLRNTLGVSALIILFSIGLCSTSSASILKTPAEEVNFTAYSQNEEIACFLSALVLQSPEAAVQVVGRSKEVEGYPAKDIFLCIITEERAFDPRTLNRGKPTLLLTAAQHGGEQSAKEAALWLIRDLALGDLKPLLKKMNFLIIPQTNPYGNYFDRRRNEIDLDMNRDHIKLEAEGVQAIHRVFTAWMPEVTLDAHEKGDDYYRISIGCVSNLNIHQSLQDFSRNTLLTQVEKSLAKRRLAFHEYLVEEEMGVNTASGAELRPDETAGREMMMRYSTTDINDGRNSLGIFETLSFIQECASRGDLLTLGERTTWQYYGMRYFAEAVADRGAEVVRLVRGLREALQTRAKAYSENDLVHLKMEFARDEKNPTLTIKEFKDSESSILGLLKTDKKAGESVTDADLAPYPFPPKQKVITRIIKNWFPGVVPKLSVRRPLAYVIPSAHQQVVETLLRLGVKVEMFVRDWPLEVEAYEVVDVLPAKYDYLAPEKIEIIKKSLTTIIKKGDFYVASAQPAANLVSLLLEPQSDFGLIRYRKYNLVPEKGAIFSFFRLTKTGGLPLLCYKDWNH
jgi:hypothetical protein